MLAICLFLQYSTVWKCSNCLKWSCVSQHVCWAVLTSCVARMTETSRSVCNFSWEGAIARETTDRCFSSTLPACCPLPQQYCSRVLYLTFPESNKYYLQLEQVPLLALPVPLVRWRTMPTGKLQNCNSRHQEKASSWDGWFRREMAFF